MATVYFKKSLCMTHIDSMGRAYVERRVVHQRLRKIKVKIFNFRYVFTYDWTEKLTKLTGPLFRIFETIKAPFRYLATPTTQPTYYPKWLFFNFYKFIAPILNRPLGYFLNLYLNKKITGEIIFGPKWNAFRKYYVRLDYTFICKK